MKKLINIQSNWQRSLVAGVAIAMINGVGEQLAIAQPVYQKVSQQISHPVAQKIAQKEITQERSANIEPNAQTNIQMMQAGDFNFPLWVWAIGGVVVIFVFLPQLGWILGLIVVGEREVGIVVKKFSLRGD
jgi:hypothetical protein